MDCCSRKKTFLRRPLLQRQPHTLLTFALQLYNFTVLRIKHCSTVSDCIAGLCFLLDHSIEQHCTLNSSRSRRGRRGRRWRATTSSLFLVAPSKFEVQCSEGSVGKIGREKQVCANVQSCVCTASGGLQLWLFDLNLLSGTRQCHSNISTAGAQC